MKFTPVLFAGLAAAVPYAKHAVTDIVNPAHSINGTAPNPSTYENVDITDFSVREEFANSSTVQSIASVYFVLNGNTTCRADSPGLEGIVFGCGETPYSFGLINGSTTTFGLRLYKATSTFAGLTGTGDVPTYCHSGGGSIEICNQIAETTIVVTAA